MVHRVRLPTISSSRREDRLRPGSRSDHVLDVTPREPDIVGRRCPENEQPDVLLARNPARLTSSKGFFRWRPSGSRGRLLCTNPKARCTHSKAGCASSPSMEPVGGSGPVTNAFERAARSERISRGRTWEWEHRSPPTSIDPFDAPTAGPRPCLELRNRSTGSRSSGSSSGSIRRRALRAAQLDVVKKRHTGLSPTLFTVLIPPTRTSSARSHCSTTRSARSEKPRSSERAPGTARIVASDEALEALGVSAVLPDQEAGGCVSGGCCTDLAGGARGMGRVEAERQRSQGKEPTELPEIEEAARTRTICSLFLLT